MGAGKDEVWDVEEEIRKRGGGWGEIEAGG